MNCDHLAAVHDFVDLVTLTLALAFALSLLAWTFTATGTLAVAPWAGVARALSSAQLVPRDDPRFLDVEVAHGAFPFRDAHGHRLAVEAEPAAEAHNTRNRRLSRSARAVADTA